jgi:Ca-activated chloride channel family protein
MLDFEHPQRLYLLLALLPLVALFGWNLWWRASALRRFGRHAASGALVPRRSGSRLTLRFALQLLALASVVLALANLRMGSRVERVQREGADIMLAIDLSRSMLAEDVKPNRLDRTKFFVSQLLRELSNDKVGLVVFAGNAYLQMPLTVDSRAALMYLNILNTDLIPRQGTAIGEAISLAMEAFDEGQGEGSSKKNRALIILSDGENNEGDALDLAAQAAEKGIMVMTVGVGTGKGGPIPVASRAGQTDFKKDKEGNIVLSRLNEDMLRQIAVAGNGEYYHISGGAQAIRDMAAALDRLDKELGEAYEYTDYRKHYAVFLAIALLLLILDFLLSDRSSLWWKKLRLLEP